MTYDLTVLSVRHRQEELRSLAGDIVQGRRAHEGARPLAWRPVHLRLVALLFGPR